MSAWFIREERPADAEAVAAVIEAAFRDMAYSDGTAHTIPGRLRACGQLSVSLVADADGTPVGHVAFSPVSISDGSAGWYGLGPVAVLPAWQGQGVGSAIIRTGLERLRALGAQGCTVLGAPHRYERFGFRHDPRLRFPGPPAQHFMRLVLAGPEPSGEVRYAPAFY